METCPKCGHENPVVRAAEYTAETDPEQPAQEDDVRWDADEVKDYLATPEKPEPDKLVGWVVASFFPVINVIIFLAAPIHIYYKFVMAAIFAATVSSAVMPEWEWPTGWLGGGFFLFYFAALFLDRGRRLDELENVRLPEYRTMLAQWQWLLYCRNCQVAWLDGKSSLYAPVEETEDLLLGKYVPEREAGDSGDEWK
jgi:hypothetical protein